MTPPGHLHELRTVAPRAADGGMPVGRIFEAAVSRFSLLAGEVRSPGAAPLAMADATGPGWRVEDGV